MVLARWYTLANQHTVYYDIGAAMHDYLLFSDSPSDKKEEHLVQHGTLRASSHATNQATCVVWCLGFVHIGKIPDLAVPILDRFHISLITGQMSSVCIHTILFFISSFFCWVKDSGIPFSLA